MTGPRTPHIEHVESPTQAWGDAVERQGDGGPNLRSGRERVRTFAACPIGKDRLLRVHEAHHPAANPHLFPMGRVEEQIAIVTGAELVLDGGFTAQ